MKQDTYHMLWSSDTNRIIIHTTVLSGYISQRTVRASCWIAAKKKLGFDLTPLQEEMLNAKNNSAAPHRGTVVNLKDARTKLRVTN